MTNTPCRAMKYMHLRGAATKLCSLPMCPSCWHMRHAELFSYRDVRLTGNIYARSTWDVRWDQDLHPALLDRFRLNRPGCKLLAYALTFDAASKYRVDAQADSFQGQLTYKLTGLFRTDKPMREYGADQHGQIQVYDGGAVAGVIDRVELDPETAFSEWLDTIRHPWEWRRHDIFNDYLKAFRPQAFAKRSVRVNTRFIQESFNGDS